jgi:magnesium transporter
MVTPRSETQLQDSVDEIARLLERHRVLETLTHRQEGPKRDLLEHLQHRQNLAELQMKLKALHPADVAHTLESLALPDRLLVWHQVEPARRGEVLVEVSDAVRESLVEAMEHAELVEALRGLDADDLAYVSHHVPGEVIADVTRSLDVGDRTALQTSLAYGDDTVGALMSHEVAVIREHQTVDDILTTLRQRGELPPQTDHLFVVDSRNVLRGAIPLERLLIRDPSLQAAALMRTDLVVFRPDQDADEALKAFDRYALVSAPVVDDRRKLIGRLTVDEVMDYGRREAEKRALERAGLRGEEDLFASTWESAKNRWPWLFINLVTAFIASRVIGFFEGTIEQLVALAALMPIVASVGGNTGNQTIALVIRGLALDQIRGGNIGRLFTKEVLVSILNGVMWGGLMGLFAWFIYGRLALGLVMMAAMLLNLLIAGLIGVAVPLTLERLGRDPAQGASVLLTFTTDSMGFFLFLGLAKLFLV